MVTVVLLKAVTFWHC